MSRRFPCCGWRAKRGREAARLHACSTFLAGRLTFLGISEVVALALARTDGAPARDLDDLLDVDRATRLLADERLAVA